MTRRWFLALLLMLPGAVRAQQVRITDVWARPGQAGRVTALYMTVASQAPDRLTAVSTPAAGACEIHEMLNDNGVMKMRPAGPLPVGPDHVLAFKPGGLHVMLVDLRKTLQPGDSFPVTVAFENSGKIEVTATVAKPPPR